MHFFFLSRGNYDKVRLLAEELKAKSLLYNRNDIEKGENNNWTKLAPYWINLRLQPIQLWDLSFPAEYLDIILTTLLGKDRKTEMPFSLVGNKINVLPLKFLRKALKLKPIGKYKTDKKLIMMQVENIDIVPLGLKEDKWFEPDGRIVDMKDKSDLAYEGI